MSIEYFCEQVIFAGFGGQGTVLLGKVLAQAAMEAGYEVTYMPSYGAEVRGGTANSQVVVSSEPIACPMVVEPDTLVAMNAASVSRFSPKVQKKGSMLVNSSLVKNGGDSNRDDLEIIEIPADDIAKELGNARSANMVMFGGYLQRRGLLEVDFVAGCLKTILSSRYHHTIAVNEQAIRQGAAFVSATHT